MTNTPRTVTIAQTAHGPRLHVDGEPFPSWFGTGTDDYFGAAWADTLPFQHALRARVRGGPEHEGQSTFFRLHLLDRLPFAKGFRFDQELIHTEPRTTVTTASVAYWYAKPAATDRFPPVDAKQLRLWAGGPEKGKGGK